MAKTTKAQIEKEIKELEAERAANWENKEARKMIKAQLKPLYLIWAAMTKEGIN